MPAVVLQGCSVCHLPEDHKCLGCNRFFCNCCGLSYHRDKQQHVYDREDIVPRPDPNDSSKYNECEKCSMRVPPAHAKCIYCNHDKVRPYVEKPPPNFTPERIEEMKRKYEDYENKWECDFCLTRMAHTENACTFCKKDKDKPYINQVAIELKRKSIRDLQYSRIVDDLNKKRVALSAINYLLKTGLKLTGGVAPETDSKFQKILQENYDRWPGKDKYNIREFAIAISHCTFNTSEHFCGVNRNLALRMVKRLPTALAQNLQQMVSTHGAGTLKTIFTLENKARLKEIGAFSVERPAEMASDYVANDLSGERPEIVEMILNKEFTGYPYIKALTQLVLDKDDLENVTICDIQIALNACKGNVQESKAYLSIKCPVCTDTHAKHNMVSFHEGCHVCCNDYDSVLSKCVKSRAASDWRCPGCGDPKGRNPNDASLKRLFKEFRQRVEATPKLKLELSQKLDEKLKDYEISKNPNAVICPTCQLNQILNPTILKVTCDKTDCRRKFCRRCSEDWHDGKTCVEMFKEKGVDVIECPKCHYFMEEILGRCQHFECVRDNCNAAFCPCGSVFYEGSQCEHFRDTCADMGFHAHHFRSCYTFLRDMDVNVLQNLIEMSGISYGKKCSPTSKCIQRVIKANDEEGPCDEPVYGAMGLDVCEKHYKFYLSQIIKANNLDRVDVLSMDDIVICCQARGINITLPVRTPAQSNEDYRASVIKFIKDKWPVKNRFPSR